MTGRAPGEVPTADATSYDVGSVAVKIGATDPLPSDLVTPAHTVVCQSPDAVDEVEQAWRADRERERRPPPSDEVTEDDEGPPAGRAPSVPVHGERRSPRPASGDTGVRP